MRVKTGCLNYLKEYIEEKIYYMREITSSNLLAATQYQHVNIDTLFFKDAA